MTHRRRRHRPRPHADLLDGRDRLGHPLGHVPPLVCVEMLDGRPLSFMTVAAAAVLTQIRRGAVLVPITTRTPAQFARVELPGGPARFAVTSNGGHIVVDGVADRRLAAGVSRRGSPATARRSPRSSPGWTGWRVGRLGAATARSPTTCSATWSSTWRRCRRRSWTTGPAWCADRGWVVSMQGRKIYALPRGLTKEAALGEVMQRTGADRLLAAGDGALDAGFLAMADAAIRPPHGELAETGWQVAHLTVASTSGCLPVRR